ncbi:MAG: hypothetical protein IK106_01220 [Clostridiales bacterium]|nr:hypothetical protein [Clostridiales bacterium]
MGKKRLISLLVSVVMIVAMFPAIVSADDGIDTFAEIQAAIDQGEGMFAVRLTGDCVAGEDDTCIVIPANKSVAIFLNGHKIDRNLLYADGPSEDGCVIKVENGGELWINPDSSNGGRITGGYAVNGGGICIEWGGALKMYGGTITANRASQNGGGIYFEGTSAATDANDAANLIYGGTVNNNMAENGGGIYVGMGADTVNFNDGANKGMSITGNRATAAGAGMYLDGRVKGYKLSVTSNLATSHGGGVYLGKYGHYELRGTNVVKTNQAGENGETVDEDVYLPTGKTIDVSSSGLAGTEIGVAVEDTSSQVTFTTSFSNAGEQVDPNTYFFSNDSEKEIALDTETNEAIIKSASSQQDPVSFAGYNLTLDDGQIGLNVYVDFGPLTDNETAESVAKVEFTVPGRGAKTVIDNCDANHKVTFGNKTYYMFTCTLSSLQMAEEVNAKFMIGADYIERTFSVAGYIKAYNDPTSGVVKGDNPYEGVLVQALADYGYFLQPWLSGLNGWEIGGEDGYAQMENIYNTASFADSDLHLNNVKTSLSSCQAVVNSSYGIKNVSFKLELESTNALIVTFYMDEDITDKLSVTCEYNGKTYKAYKQENGSYVIRISGIRIQDMDDEFTVKGIAGTEATEENVNIIFKPIGYAYYGITNKNSLEPKINALVALFYYWNYADLYAGVQ